VKVSLFIDTLKCSLAADSRISISEDTILVPARDSTDFALTFTTPAHADFIIAVIGALALPADSVKIPVRTTVHALSANTKYVSYRQNYVDYRLFPKYGNDFATLLFDTVTVAAYDITQFDVVTFANVGVFDYDDSIRAASTSAGPAIIPLIQKIFNAGHNVLVTSTSGIYQSFDKFSPIYSHVHTPRVVAFFDMLGVHYIKFTAYYGYPTKVTGVKGDVITDGITLNPSAEFADIFSIESSTHTKPILYYPNDNYGGDTIPAYAGFRFDDGSGHRLVYFNIDFSLEPHLPDEQAMLGNLFSKSMDFLLSTADVKKATTSSVTLEQNYPNPVSSTTKIGYTLSERTPVSLIVHDLLGREVVSVVSATHEAGNYVVNFDASNLPSGIYTYSLIAGRDMLEKMMMVMK
jgi:hypothetical protein